jgi:hypothetical protein
MWNENKYEDFAKKMEETYPKMFSKPYGGFAVGVGWWPILESLCAQIQHHIDWKQEQHQKFSRGNGCTQVEVLQIKEKFGGLRFYYDGGNDTIDGMVRMAEAWAAHSCEECGSPGERRGGGWIRTLCDVHEAEYQAKIEDRARKDGLEL